MTQNLLKTINKLIDAFDGGTAFILAMVFVILAFIFNLILSIFVIGFDYKKRLWQVFYTLAVLLTECLLTRQESGREFFLLINLSLAVTLYIPILVVPERKIAIKKEQLDLIKRVDKEIEEEKVENSRLENEKIVERDNVKREEHFKVEMPREQVKKESLDYSHVKNIIDRLNNYSLEVGDKKRVNELKFNLSLAQNGDENPQTKVKINDGLSFLLKILSKYEI